MSGKPSSTIAFEKRLTWSTTVIMKVDLGSPRNRGLAMGLNEFAGYAAVAASERTNGLECGLP